MAAMSDENVVRGSIHFLKRDALYDLEKPYTIRYALPDSTPRTNSQHEEHHGLLIQNIRPQLQHFSMESHGFTVVKMESAMMYQDFENEDRIINIYLAEVARKLRETLKARHVQVYEHTVSTSAKHHIRQAFLTVISFEDVMRPIQYPLERSTHLISLRTLRTLAGIS